MSRTRGPDFCPYKGLQPYTEDDQEFFFGRERDQAVIASNLYAAPVTVLYGASGVGKSSVLLAGVVPQLKEDPLVAVVVFRTWQGTSYQTALKGEVLKALARLQTKRDITTEQLDVDMNLPFDEFLLACDRLLPFRGRILFVFDQFEEYFLNAANGQADDNFDAELAQALNRREIPINILLSMRDDGLSKLDRFQGRIPNLMGNLLRVEHLNHSDARKAIRKPLVVYNKELPQDQQVMIEESLVEALLDKARPNEKREQTSSRPGALVHGVETPVLQILLTRLWKEERALASHTLRLDTFEKRLGGAEHIIFGYLKDVMDSLSDVEQQTAAAVFQFLTTPAKTKIAHEPVSLARWAKMDAARVLGLLERLSSREDKILRKLEVAGQPVRYEIFHDVLGAPLAEWCDKFLHERETAEAAKRAAEAAAKKAKEEALHLQLIQFEALAREQEQRAEAERERAEEQRRRAEVERLRADEQQLLTETERKRAEEKARSSARLRILTAGMAALFFLAIVTAIYAMTQRSQARVEAGRARESEKKAVAASEESEKQRKNAEESAKLAVTQAAIAQNESKRANEQALLAQNQSKRANEQAAIAQRQEAAARVATEEAERQKQIVVSQNLALAGAKTKLEDALANAETLRAAAIREREIADKARQDAVDAQKAAEAQAKLANDRLNEINASKNVDQLKDEAARLERNSDYAGAIDAYQRALAIYRQTKNESGQASTLESIGRVQYYKNEIANSVKSLNEALSHLDPIDRAGRARILTSLGYDFSRLNDRDNALKNYEEALKISEEIHDNRGKYSALTGITYVRIDEGDYKGARDALNYQLEVVQMLGNEYDLASVYFNYGQVSSKEKNYPDAVNYFLKALKIYEGTKYIAAQTSALTNLVNLYTKMGNEREAARYSQKLEALRLAKPEP